MAIHKELETKEDQIKKLEKTINGLQMENKLLLKGLYLFICSFFIKYIF